MRIFELMVRWLDRNLFSTSLEADLMAKIKSLQEENRRLSKKLKLAEKEDSVFVLCKPLIGKRYNKVILPENIQEMERWIHEELLPTLRPNATVSGRVDFFKKHT